MFSIINLSLLFNMQSLNYSESHNYLTIKENLIFMLIFSVSVFTVPTISSRPSTKMSAFNFFTYMRAP